MSTIATINVCEELNYHSSGPLFIGGIGEGNIAKVGAFDKFLNSWILSQGATQGATRAM